MGCAVVKCIAGTGGEVIQYDIATMNDTSFNHHAATDGRSSSQRLSVHVDSGELRHGEEGDVEERGAQFEKEGRHSFNCCTCGSEKSLRNEQSLKQRHSISRLLMDGEEAHTTAALKLRLLLQQLEQGDIPSVADMKKTISFAADVLSKLVPLGESHGKGEDEERLELQKVKDQHVRAWISSTFSKDTAPDYESRITPIERFRAVANTIIIGQFFGNLYKEAASFTQPKYPRGVQELFQDQLDNWDFDIFKVEALSNKQLLRFVGHELFSRHDLFRRCNISCQNLDSFLSKIEAGYGCHSNPYHNATHAADVTVTIHYFIHSLGLKAYLTDLEILAILLSAIIHDVHHPGTTNSFQIAQKSEYAMLYNDRSVLENHHLHYTFMLINDDDSNVLSGLTPEEYTQVRNMMIDMVLATDMSTHFDQIKQLKLILSGQDAAAQLLGADRPKLYNFLVHMADISHPGKPWDQHSKWTSRLCEEFFLQGDEERRLGRKCSPLCDRYDTNIPDSQHGFIQFIVGPSYDVCGDMLEIVFSSPPSTLPGNGAAAATTTSEVVRSTTNSDGGESGEGEESGEEGEGEGEGVGAREKCSAAAGLRLIRVWAEHLMENRKRWKMESSKEDSDWLKKKVETLLVPAVKKSRGKDLEPLIKEQPLCNGTTDIIEHSDSVEHTDHVNHSDQNNYIDHNDSDPATNHEHVNGSTFEKAEFHNAKNKSEERHMISTVQTVQIPGVSEVRTVQTVELRKITTNGAQQSATFQNQNHEE